MKGGRLGLAKLRGQLTDPAQLQFLSMMESAVGDGQNVSKAMTALGVRPATMVKWLDDEHFMAVWMAQGVLREVMELPGMLKLMRERAQGIGLGEKESGVGWARLYVETVAKLADTVMAGLKSVDAGDQEKPGGEKEPGETVELEPADVADLGLES